MNTLQYSSALAQSKRDFNDILTPPFADEYLSYVGVLEISRFRAACTKTAALKCNHTRIYNIANRFIRLSKDGVNQYLKETHPSLVALRKSWQEVLPLHFSVSPLYCTALPREQQQGEYAHQIADYFCQLAHKICYYYNGVQLERENAVQHCFNYVFNKHTTYYGEITSNKTVLTQLLRIGKKEIDTSSSSFVLLSRKPEPLKEEYAFHQTRLESARSNDTSSFISEYLRFNFDPSLIHDRMKYLTLGNVSIKGNLNTKNVENLVAHEVSCVENMTIRQKLTKLCFLNSFDLQGRIEKLTFPDNIDYGLNSLCLQGTQKFPIVLGDVELPYNSFYEKHVASFYCPTTQSSHRGISKAHLLLQNCILKDSARKLVSTFFVREGVVYVHLNNVKNIPEAFSIGYDHVNKPDKIVMLIEHMDLQKLNLNFACNIHAAFRHCPNFTKVTSNNPAKLNITVHNCAQSNYKDNDRLKNLDFSYWGNNRPKVNTAFGKLEKCFSAQ